MDQAFRPPLSSRTSRAAGGLLLTLFLSVLPLFAEPVEIKSFRPPVDVQRANIPEKWFPVKVGLTLKEGDVIRTGARGQVDLRMADGSRMVLGPGSRLQIQETGANRRFGLDAGRIKSFIKKLKPGNKFEMKTPLAAASVRGTVFEMGFDEGNRSGFLDVSEGAVALIKDNQEVLVPEGSRLEFVPDKPLGEPVPSQAGGESSDAQAQVRREVGLGMSKEEVMAAAAEEMRLAEYQEGKTLIDVNGQRVRLQEYIIRKPKEVTTSDRDKAFKLVVLNEREDRFDYFYYRGVFNTSLPEDLSLALRDVNGKLGTTAPSYYLTEYEMGQSNTTDFIKDNASGGHLVRDRRPQRFVAIINYDGTSYTLTDPTDASNTRTVTADEQVVVDNVTYHKIYDPVNDRFTTLTDAQFQAGDYRPTVYDPSDDSFRRIGTGDTYWRTRYNNYTHVLNTATKQSYTKKSTVANTLAVDLDADFTYAGGTLLSFTETPSGSDLLHNRVTLFYGDGTKEVYDTYIISDEGAIAPASAFNNVSTGQAFKTELLKWNYQQVATATEFQGRKIDLVVEPKILIKSGLIK